MQTIRIISNISYNSMPFFEMKVNELLENSVIDWCYWIRHEPDEDDEKHHIHFVLKPSSRLDTTKLRAFFFEVDENNVLPLTCTMRWHSTNSIDDWLLYAIHHPAYLAHKGQCRRYHYNWSDVKTTDLQALKNDIASIDLRKYLVLQWLEDAAISKVPFYKLVQDGLVPISQRSQYELQYKALYSAYHNVPAKPRPKLEYMQDNITNPFENS